MRCLVRVKLTGAYYGRPGRIVTTRREAHVYDERHSADAAHLREMFGLSGAKALLVLEVLPNET